LFLHSILYPRLSALIRGKALFPISANQF